MKMLLALAVAFSLFFVFVSGASTPQTCPVNAEGCNVPLVGVHVLRQFSNVRPRGARVIPLGSQVIALEYVNTLRCSTPS
jgi:hypothetical protein